MNSGQILLIDGDLLLKFLGVGRELLQQVLLRPNLLTGVVLSAGLTELRDKAAASQREAFMIGPSWEIGKNCTELAGRCRSRVFVV